jgi:hypothetical protein
MGRSDMPVFSVEEVEAVAEAAALLVVRYQAPPNGYVGAEEAFNAVEIQPRVHTRGSSRVDVT